MMESVHFEGIIPLFYYDINSHSQIGSHSCTTFGLTERIWRNCICTRLAFQRCYRFFINLFCVDYDKKGLTSMARFRRVKPHGDNSLDPILSKTQKFKEAYFAGTY